MAIAIVTWNGWKFAEISSVLEWLDLKQVTLDIEEIQTTSLTEISADKCLKAFETVWWPVLVDDTWIYMDALNEFPWALWKQFIAWIWVEWIKKLYTWVENRKATFVSVISYMDDTLAEPKQFIWEVDWTLVFDFLDREDTNPSLPYNRIFQADWMDVPALFDLDTWKKEYNFRIKAVKEFKEWILEKNK